MAKRHPLHCGFSFCFVHSLCGFLYKRISIIQTLVMKTEIAGVQSDFQFARPGVAAMPYRGHDCLRRYAKVCGTNRPQHITSTNMRKQLTTVG